MWTNSESDPIRYGCKTYEGKEGFGDAVVAGRDPAVPLDPAEEILNNPAAATYLRDIENPVCPVGLRRDHRDPALSDDMRPEFIAVIALVAQDDLAFDIPEDLLGEKNVMAVARCERDPQGLALPVHAGVEFRVPPALGLAQRPICGISGVAARVLVGFEMGGVDCHELVGFGLLRFGGGSFQQSGEDPALRPPEVKAVNAVPFSEAFGQLVPDRSGHKNPPDPVQGFSKIGRLSPLLWYIGPTGPKVNLIFLGGRKPHPA